MLPKETNQKKKNYIGKEYSTLFLCVLIGLTGFSIICFLLYKNPPDKQYYLINNTYKTNDITYHNSGFAGNQGISFVDYCTGQYVRLQEYIEIDIDGEINCENN